MEETRDGLTPDQAEAYAREGVVRLPGAVPAAGVEAMLAALWKRLESWHGVWRDKPATWTIAHPAQLSSRNDDFAAMGSTRVRAIADQLLGAGRWKEPERWGLPMVTLPGHCARWDVPRKWHLDIAATPEPPRVLRFFLILAPVAPRGGGTGYIAGSHRVIRRLAMREGVSMNTGVIRKLLIAREPWYAALESRRKDEDRVARFMSGGMLDGVPVRVCEMTGEPGDVFLMDPLMLHATTPNAGETPRMMLMEGLYAA